MKTDHSSPFPVFQISLRRPADALWLMQAEETVIELTDDVVCAQKVVEKPLLPESLDIRVKDGGSVRPEAAGLIYSDQNIFEVEGF